jgi:hypothetical protein
MTIRIGLAVGQACAKVVAGQAAAASRAQARNLLRRGRDGVEVLVMDSFLRVEWAWARPQL